MGRATTARWAFLDHPGPLAFAHRGGALEAPENTWAAFERARRLGFRYLETDARLTGDGVVVAIHDPALDRVSDRGGRVRDLSWAEVSAAQVAGGQGVPRLEDLLGAWPDAHWNIDAKADAVVDPLVDAIRRTGTLERVCVTSFADRRVRRARRALGARLCTAPGRAGVARLRAASLLGPATPAGLGAHGAVQVPRHHRGVRVLDERLVVAAHRAGLQVHVWTVDDPDGMEEVLDLGVDGVMTDRPEVLRGVLERRGQWA